MKNILVPIDFSEASNNALEYAFQLASETKAAVTILNVYHIPLPAGEVPMMLISPHEILQKTNERLNELAAAARLAFEGKITITSMAREGFAAEEILTVAQELKIDLIVMGTRGGGSRLGVLLGSITLEVMKKSPVPVLIIPASARYIPVQQILFAFDYTKPSRRIISRLKNYAESFGAQINVVNVVDPASDTDMNTALSGVALENGLATVPHRLYFPEGSDVAGELSKFAKEHKTDWMVVVPHTHGFFHSLFQGSVAGKIATHVETPVLSIHE